MWKLTFAEPEGDLLVGLGFREGEGRLGFLGGQVEELVLDEQLLDVVLLHHGRLPVQGQVGDDDRYVVTQLKYR